MPIDGVSPCELISFNSILRDPLPPIIWDVEKLIPRGNRVVVYGEFRSFKSWVLLDLGLHLAAGKPWFGHFLIPQARKVLYVDEEMSETTMRRRVKRLSDGAGLAVGNVDFRVASHCSLRCDEEGMTALLRSVRWAAFDPDVVIIETMRRVLRGSENSAEDVAAMWRGLDVLTKEGKTVILSHHMRKAKFDSYDPLGNRASGSTDIMAGADTSYAIVRKAKTMNITVTCEKSRDAEEAPPFNIELVAPGSDDPASMEYRGEKQQDPAHPSKLEEAKNVIMGIFTDSSRVYETAKILAQAQLGGVMTRRTAESALTALRESGYLTQPKKGFYQVPDVPHKQAA